MMAYKRRYRKYRRNSTQVIKMKFQSFMDISTDTDSMKIITISAGGPNILDRCRAQFAAYKYYKIGNISVKLVPASTLPVDPSGLSYEVGEAGVDPRDQLSPGLMRITNGEDILEDISGMSSADQHYMYNSMMLDPHWYKWMLQRGVKRHATPRYWQVGQLHQDKWPGMFTNLPDINVADGVASLQGTHCLVQQERGDALANDLMWMSSSHGMFQTGHRGVLGWLPTDGLSIVRPTGSSDLQQIPTLASPPEIAVFTICLPKAFKTRYYYRAFISETVYFREPIVSVGVNSYGDYRPIDVFHSIRPPVPMMPNVPDPYSSIPDSSTGGNYGDD